MKKTKEQKEAIDTGGVMGKAGVYQPDPPPSPVDKRQVKLFGGGIIDESSISNTEVQTKVVQPTQEASLSTFRIATPWNRVHLTRKWKEPGGGKSRTIPDQSLTIKELLLRQERGYPLDATRTVIYNGEDDNLPDLRRLDINDIHELREWANLKIKDHNKLLDQERLALQEKQTEEYYKKKFSIETTNPAPSAGRSEPSPGQNDK